VIDALIVGAGFSGLHALHRLREAGFAAKVVERADGVGGTWWWNRYPGARCDVESIDYAYGFDDALREGWRWTERYAAQPEILAYLEHVADRFDLRRDIALRTEVTGARWAEDEHAWHVATGDGATTIARHLILAVGNLTAPKRPDLPGLEAFAGEWHHTSRWPRGGVDLGGRDVAILGTGSTGIQATTAVAGVARRLHVLQRTPNYSMPARNRPLAEDELDAANATWAQRRAVARASDAGVPAEPPTRAALAVTDEEREAAYAAGWRRGGISALSGAFTDFFTSEAANRTAQDFARARIREVVRDPATAEALCPRHHIGTKRTCVDTGYFEAFNRDDVVLVDVRADPIERVAARGLVLRSGREVPADVLVVATGFDAMTGAFTALDLRGRDGVALRDAWAGGPRTHLGLAVAGFPNLWLVTGPGSPGVLSNMVVSIEQHVDWIARCLEHLRERGATRIEATAEAQDAWVRHVADLASGTLYPDAASWYLGANIPGKPRVFMPYVGGVGRYRRECDEEAARGYAGFVVSGAREGARA
jgi:cation diffusion facilitator CzcD-associated flavoprotein CzcO